MRVKKSNSNIEYSKDVWPASPPQAVRRVGPGPPGAPQVGQRKEKKGSRGIWEVLGGDALVGTGAERKALQGFALGFPEVFVGFPGLLLVFLRLL